MGFKSFVRRLSGSASKAASLGAKTVKVPSPERASVNPAASMAAANVVSQMMLEKHRYERVDDLDKYSYYETDLPKVPNPSVELATS